MNRVNLSFLSIFCAFAVQAQGTVTVSRPEFTDPKAVVPLAMTNSLAKPVECKMELNQPLPADSAIKARILQYGITTSAIGTSVNAPSDPTGRHLVLARGTTSLETATNRIPAKIGVAFGSFCEITGLEQQDRGEAELTVVWTYPSMIKPDGAVSTGFAYRGKLKMDSDGRASGWVGYHFENSYELVPGEWRLELKYRGIAIATQAFTVFKPLKYLPQ